LTSNVSNPLHLLQGLLKSEGDLQTGWMLKKIAERQTVLNNPEKKLLLFIYVSFTLFFKNITPHVQVCENYIHIMQVLQHLQQCQFERE
jgi:hypothetical protein